ncbi:MAG: serine/threonine protein kinase [Planctomycetaceae bacterium]|nr:serine/threonine protein kinase [Planctomycetaceae bacterium]
MWLKIEPRSLPVSVVSAALTQVLTDFMQSPAVANDFFSLLEKSRLATAAQCERIIQKLQISPDASAISVARRLVAGRVLTPFQAERLLEGRYRGLVIDRYRIREVLGFGGMGCVFIAEDPQEQKKVAIKVLSAEMAMDAGLLTRMKLEASAGMRLDHPNIVRTFRIDSTGAIHYLVMELVRGISLHELVALRGPLHWAFACDVAMQAATALQVAHEQGIIHRDIKPANFLIEQSGVCHALDFGLALIQDSPDEEFSLSMLFGHNCLGTPDYIAPEQSLDSSAVDARADVYGLGATFYVALTGRVPFPDKATRDKLEAHRTRKAPDPCAVRKEIPKEVGAIVMKMMAKKPEDRYTSMGAVVQALKPLAKRQAVRFDFRELVTLRVRLARNRAENAPRKPIAGPRSSITSPSGWLTSESHHLAETVDAFAQSETPAIRTDDTRPAALSGRETRSRHEIPPGWFLEQVETKMVIPILKSSVTIGNTKAADCVLRGCGADAIQCRIDFDGMGWTLTQLSDKRPTLVDGRPMASAALHSGNLLTFGRTAGLRLTYHPETSE